MKCWCWNCPEPHLQSCLRLERPFYVVPRRKQRNHSSSATTSSASPSSVHILPFYMNSDALRAMHCGRIQPYLSWQPLTHPPIVLVYIIKVCTILQGNLQSKLSFASHCVTSAQIWLKIGLTKYICYSLHGNVPIFFFFIIGMLQLFI